MKKILVKTFACVLLAGMVTAQQPAPTQTPATTSAEMPAFAWEKTSHSFGKIPQGKPVSVVFSFTNTGSKALILTSVSPGCGCTTEDYSKEAIAPGKKGFVKLIFNAAAIGPFTKSATVTANTNPGVITLYFNGEVVPADAMPAP